MVRQGIPGRGSCMGKGVECLGCCDELLAMAGTLGMGSGGKRTRQRGRFAMFRGLAFVSVEPGKDDS